MRVIHFAMLIRTITEFDMAKCITLICVNRDQLYDPNVCHPGIKCNIIMQLNTKKMFQSNVKPPIDVANFVRDNIRFHYELLILDKANFN